MVLIQQRVYFDRINFIITNIMHLVIGLNFSLRKHQMDYFQLHFIIGITNWRIKDFISYIPLFVKNFHLSYNQIVIGHHNLESKYHIIEDLIKDIHPFPFHYFIMY
jgi:hypothetical protein